MTTKKIKVAIVGVGNCASALIQGFEYYKGRTSFEGAGIMFPDIGGYSPTDIEVVAAFDVDRRKIGKRLGSAIFAKPNCCRVFVDPDSIKDYGPVVMKAPVLDGVAPHMMENKDEMYMFDVDISQVPVSLDEVLAATKPDIVINYLPVGSQKATENLAEVCIRQKIAFMNCIPVFIGSDPVWENKFIEAGIPLIGDDMRSQVGSSVVSQMLNELFISRGAKMHHHIQENRGSNNDFCNMTDKTRLISKKTSKENVLKAVFIQNKIDPDSVTVYAGPSNFVPLHNDNKEGIFEIVAEGFGGAPIKFQAFLKVCDSENSAGVVIDAIRHLKVASELGMKGTLRGPSAFTQKTPPQQLPFQEAFEECKLIANREIPHYMLNRMGDLCQ
jgi:myo-inositol-1-phosphate synthase